MSTSTTYRSRLLTYGRHTLACMGALAILWLAGCVPVPYRPAASVTHAAIASEDAAATVLAVDSARGVTRAVTKAVVHEEPRVVIVDPAAFMSRLAPAASWTLANVAAACQASEQPCAADYLLSVGVPDNRKLHDTGAWAPFFFVPSAVGYEKIQSRETLTGSLLDLRRPDASERLFSVSNYTEVTAGLFYGFSTIAMPESAVQRALARDVAHRLAQTQPQGAIRLVVFGETSSAYLDEPPVDR